MKLFNIKFHHANYVDVLIHSTETNICIIIHIIDYESIIFIFIFIFININININFVQQVDPIKIVNFMIITS
jgi:hypothetical protein